ncbi:hypothetical protein KIL84_013969 [Mauremys mutica]|uniref:Uncharacterized protein n=1 Tax=Mauremys mutica TaxID=74926 RepID=A0A9D4AT02_9SAUR|nr:hypothetical protein KIL84_013969 [Mauremys mutica]
MCVCRDCTCSPENWTQLPCPSSESITKAGIESRELGSCGKRPGCTGSVWPKVGLARGQGAGCEMGGAVKLLCIALEKAQRVTVRPCCSHQAIWHALPTAHVASAASVHYRTIKLCPSNINSYELPLQQPLYF